MQVQSLPVNVPQPHVLLFWDSCDFMDAWMYPVCPVSFYYGRINKTGIARESEEVWQREGSQRHYRVYTVVFSGTRPETQTFRQKWWCHVTPTMPTCVGVCP